MSPAKTANKLFPCTNLKMAKLRKGEATVANSRQEIFVGRMKLLGQHVALPQMPRRIGMCGHTPTNEVRIRSIKIFPKITRKSNIRNRAGNTGSEYAVNLEKHQNSQIICIWPARDVTDTMLFSNSPTQTYYQNYSRFRRVRNGKPTSAQIHGIAVEHSLHKAAGSWLHTTKIILEKCN